LELVVSPVIVDPPQSRPRRRNTRPRATREGERAVVDDPVRAEREPPSNAEGAAVRDREGARSRLSSSTRPFTVTVLPFVHERPGLEREVVIVMRCRRHLIRERAVRS